MSISKDKRRYHHKIYRSILKDWYGEERGRTEMSGYCPESVKISDLVDKVMHKAIPEDRLRFMSIKEKWPTLAGLQLSKVSEPISMEDGIVLVAVTHPAWMREMQGPVKKTLIANINKELGKELCKEIRFIPSGR